MFHPYVPFCRNLVGQYEHPAFLSLLKTTVFLAFKGYILWCDPKLTFENPVCYWIALMLKT